MSHSRNGVQHIALNAHLLSLDESYRTAGIHAYIRCLLDNLPVSDPSMNYTAFVGERRYVPTEPTIRTQLSRLPTAYPPVRILWEQLVQPFALWRRRVDLLHAMAFVGPLIGSCAMVVTVFDLSFVYYPGTFRAGKRMYLRLFTKASVRRARRIIAISEQTKADLVRWLDLPPDRIDVVYCGVEKRFHPLPAQDVEAFRQKRGLPKTFLLSVGTLEPRKNLGMLLNAYAQLRSAAQSAPPLILVGGKGWRHESLFARASKLGMADSVRFVGFVPSQELPLWYNAATCCVYPSLYEGFGLPPLEAMACGTPTLTSDSSSLPEIVGSAGLLVDPHDEVAWAQQLTRVLSAPELRRELAEKGQERARRFTWQRAADETVRVYQRALMERAHV
jgi:glycosyltransferase involved in cell wall biosynthesis